MFSNANAFLPLLGLFSYTFAAKQELLKAKKESPFDAKFAKLANETLDLWHVPGVAIGVVDGDDTWAEGYGIATFPDTPVTPSTLFYTGSTTKAFTAAAVSLLIDNTTYYPDLQWDTPISDLIREDFVLQDDYATTHTTLEDALSHRSGMPRHDLSYGGHYDGHKGTPRDIVRSLRHLPLTAAPRTKWQYCNMMFVTVSYVIETLTGMWLGDFLNEKIWDPLGMKSTYFSTRAAQAAPEHLAQGYVYYRKKYQSVPYMDLDITSGAGSVVSNVLDYTKWLHAHLTTAGPISKAGYEALQTPRMLLSKAKSTPFTGPQAYTLGWTTMVYKGYQLFQHSGGMEAFGATVIYFPELKYGVVAFGNTALTSNNVEERLVWKLIDDKLEIAEKDRFDWNKRNQEALKEGEEQYNNAVKIFYPNKPDPPLSPSLPLQNYTGTYFHPAYRNITFFLKKDLLHMNREDVAWKMFGDLQHVTGDYFMAYVDSSTAPGLIFKAAVPAGFKIGSDGAPKAFGIAAEEKMGKDGRIWFDKI